MDCPLLTISNIFVHVTVQKLQREQPWEIWSIISSELGIFVKRNVLGGCWHHRKLWSTCDKWKIRGQRRQERHLCREHSISKSTVWYTLRFVLKKKAYHIQVLQHFKPGNYAARMAMCPDTTAGYGQINNHACPWNWNMKLHGASSNSAFKIHSFLLKQQLRQHRNWTCFSNSCGPTCLLTTFWTLWWWNRTAHYRTLRTLWVIAST